MRAPSVLVGDRRGLAARLVANGFAQGVVAAIAAILARYAFDTLIGHAAATPPGIDIVMGLAAAFIASAGITAWLRAIERVDVERLGQDYVCEIRLGIFRHLSSLSPRALQRHSRGGMMLRFVGDLTALRNWVSFGLARLLVSSVALLLAVSALAVIEPVFAVAVGAVLAIGGVTTFSVGQKLYGAAREARRRQAQLAANVSEKIAAMAVVQLFGQQEREQAGVSRQSKRLKAAMVARARLAGWLRGTIEATTSLTAGAVLLAGTAESIAGRTTPGTVVAGLVIVGLLSARVRDLSRVYEYWTAARISREKIEKFLSIPKLVDEARHAIDLQVQHGRVEFDRVTVSGALDDVTVVAEPGSIVAVIGPNGAGKSTLLALAARLVDPDQGRVLIDGQDLRKCTLNSVRHAVGMASPDLPLMRGTIKKNLRYRCPDASANDVARVAALAGLDWLNAETRDGLKTRVAEGGANLSLGQRQSIALARALIGNPKVLLLDETDTHLDARAASALDLFLDSFQGTVLLVTHRADRLRRVDQIWHLDGGRLVEAGSLDTLLAKGSSIADLFKHTIRLVS